LKLQEHPKIIAIIQELWSSTFSTCLFPFDHPFGAFDPTKALSYIDRICFRLPDSLSKQYGTKKRPLQRGLAPHLDCCPHALYTDSIHKKKWKPIQAFVSLTATLDRDCGGFECCPGLHKRFDAWASTRPGTVDTKSGAALPPVCVGEYTPIRPLEDADIIQSFTHVPCGAGALVLWDNRIPHANSRFNSSDSVREVVYIGVLPHTDKNIAYAANQLERMRSGLLPSDQWHSSSESTPCSFEFSELGNKLMGITEW
jgi:hypothetical protein